MRSPKESLDIVIAGGGLAGLAAACRLAQDGHHIRLLERASALSIASGAIFVQSNAVRCIQRWGLDTAFQAVVSEIASTQYRNGYTNETQLQRRGSVFTDVPIWSTDRKALQKVFFDLATSAGAAVMFMTTVVDITEHADSVTVTCQDGKTLTCDLFLAADGISSRLREKILPEHNVASLAPIAEPSTHYPAEIPREALLSNNLTKFLVTGDARHDNMMYTGKGGYVVVKYNQSRELCNIMWSIQHGVGSEEDKNPRLFDETGDVNTVRDFFADWHPTVRALADMMSSCSRWRLARLAPLDTWSSKGRRVVLLGDSAHAMLPNLAQGFSAIVEDVDALSLLLQGDRSVEDAIDAWEKFRIPRVNVLQQVSLHNYSCFNRGLTPQDLMTEEEKNLPMGQGDAHAPANSPPWWKWVLDYDVALEVGKISKQNGETVLN